MALSPMMQQYLEMKEKYKDCILFFRVGDFYEMFFDDAEIASKALELVLTGKDCGLENRAPMCGIPFHASKNYLGRLISKGFKVAICEQVEDPAKAKGLVKRDVIRVVTPGTFNDSSFIDEEKNNFIMSVYHKGDQISLAVSDISTGDFSCTSFNGKKALLLDEISKFSPTEILINENMNSDIADSILYLGIMVTRKDDSYFENDATYLSNQFSKEESQKLNDIEQIVSCALLKYICDTQKCTLSNINRIDRYEILDYMTIDSNTRRNLELTENIHEKNKKGSLLWVMDKTKTSMGSRQLRKWIEQPLLNKKAIEERLDSVEELYYNVPLNDDLRESLNKIYDIERIVGKIATKNVNAKDLISLKNSLTRIPELRKLICSSSSAKLNYYYNNIDELNDLKELLEKSLIEDAPMSVKDGDIIKTGYNSEVDELRGAKLHGKEWIAKLENQEREFTGIKSLKVGYNKVFGYYIEISKSNYDLIPEGRYIRKQTLTNAERFITDELKEVENKILGAEEKLCSLEYSLFVDIRNKIEAEIQRMQKTAKLIAELDCISTFAFIALENNYIKPIINKEGYIDIKDGRHPVVEKVIPKENFISNDTLLNKDKNNILIITGPNMAGKSTYMRQVALITLMAHIGSYVPASKADISVCDKIFTRIGASDDLAGGKSTFMVEMAEVSNILKNATNNSLVLLDEVGRGTSTYDGLSIAWSVVEHISKSPDLKCKTLFATHYHELTKLEDELPGVKNYSVAVKEIDNSVVFLRKIVEGGADHSYGIEVAKLAGLPEKVIKRAKDILKELENNTDIEEAVVDTEFKTNNEVKSKVQESSTEDYLIDTPMQMDFSMLAKEELIKELKDIDIINITPMKAFNKLYEIINKAKEI
ncbi:MAG: DNA mismatch repair protein MutS [Inconstantimicrobium porci]|uniref:DNA mismatch repair protein MutS n=1 Tax=Inconstantimicrobium porci TaxID=2652291 RepID=A0A7X2MW54_9CLOT|nr:DNA mismatch repair protein MutS [Inconstantimicrobium porci]MDD6772058.1 DNA mismatch repair protein MutS [Inconstantimicrobium porci]MDY5912102.1 DNA mismatch repair protein MutS [Inconstantimicrobium porci]MSR90186.1 DNA mismatch repair protein MutS [Inconstantimicrobium porci]